MSKLLLMSIMIATLAIPMRHVRDEDPELALRTAMKEFFWFNLLYVVTICYVVPRMM